MPGTICIEDMKTGMIRSRSIAIADRDTAVFALGIHRP